jgi:hypothetical protein
MRQPLRNTTLILRYERCPSGAASIKAAVGPDSHGGFFGRLSWRPLSHEPRRRHVRLAGLHGALELRRRNGSARRRMATLR